MLNKTTTIANNPDNVSPAANCLETDTFVTGGTLGDMFFVLCKLYDYHKKTGRRIRIIRYSMTTELDGAINQLYKLAPYVELEPCIKTCSNSESDKKIKEIAEHLPYINQMHDGCSETMEVVSANTSIVGLPDPEYIRMEPFPDFDIPLQEFGDDNFHLGLQLHCGSLGSNFRGLNPTWVARLSRKLQDDNVTVHLLGTGDGYDKAEIEKLEQISNIRNWVGTLSFTEWLTLMKSMNGFISLEGFSAFFAMSQKVPTIMYNQYAQKLDCHIHPEWRRGSLIIDINLNKFVRKIRHLRAKYFKQKNRYSPSNMNVIDRFLTNLKKEGKNGNQY